MPEAKTMLAAVLASEERLIAFRYMMQISTHFAFSYVRIALFASQNTSMTLKDPELSK